MTKRTNRYHLTLEKLGSTDEANVSHETIKLEFDNHDELFGIVERAKQKNLFNDPNQSTEFAIGLKLFSEVMLKNRSNPLFEDFAPAFREFMKKVKHR